MATSDNRKPLLAYLPEYMQTYDEIRRIAEAEQPQVNLAWSDLESVWNNQYLFDSDVRGVARREAMFGIQPKATDTLDERKFRIYTQMNQELPYTYNKLAETLTALCGDEGWMIILDSDNYAIEIRLDLTNKNNREAAEELLHKMVPANMVVTVRIIYNQHSKLATYTHNELSAYTHDELRNEVLE